MACTFAQAGASGLALVARTQTQLDESKQAIAAINPDCVVLLFSLDVSHAEQVQEMMDDVIKSFKRLDVVLANAGIMEKESEICDIDPLSWWGIYVWTSHPWLDYISSNGPQEVNVKGTFNICQAYLRQRRSGGEKHEALGFIIATSDIGSSLYAPVRFRVK